MNHNVYDSTNNLLRRNGMLGLITAVTLFFAGCSEENHLLADDAAASAEVVTAPTAADSKGLTVLNFPQEDPGPPLYASGLGGGFPGFGAVRTNGEWAAITFVREPSCVPDSFNLLSGPDVPQAFLCPLTIEGKLWRRDLTDPNPLQARQEGLGAVPIYFVLLSELEAATADDQLTIVELNSLPSLVIGHAHAHRDVIQFPAHGARAGQHSTVSRGDLTDGRSFQFSGVIRGTENVNTQIRFN